MAARGGGIGLAKGDSLHQGIVGETWESSQGLARGGLECQNEDFELYLLDYPQLLRCFELAEMALQVGANCGRP